MPPKLSPADVIRQTLDQLPASGHKLRQVPLVEIDASCKKLIFTQRLHQVKNGQLIANAAKLGLKAEAIEAVKTRAAGGWPIRFPNLAGCDEGIHCTADFPLSEDWYLLSIAGGNKINKSNQGPVLAAVLGGFPTYQGPVPEHELDRIASELPRSSMMVHHVLLKCGTPLGASDWTPVASGKLHVKVDGPGTKVSLFGASTPWSRREVNGCTEKALGLLAGTFPPKVEHVPAFDEIWKDTPLALSSIAAWSPDKASRDLPSDPITWPARLDLLRRSERGQHPNWACRVGHPPGLAFWDGDIQPRLVWLLLYGALTPAGKLTAKAAPIVRGLNSFAMVGANERDLLLPFGVAGSDDLPRPRVEPDVGVMYTQGMGPPQRQAMAAVADYQRAQETANSNPDLVANSIPVIRPLAGCPKTLRVLRSTTRLRALEVAVFGELLDPKIGEFPEDIDWAHVGAEFYGG
jgi:hypothetical protein